MTDSPSKTPIRKEEMTTSFNSNLRVEIKSLVIDARDISFDINEHLGLKIPESLIEEWDSDSEIPFKCELECYVSSNGKPLTCPISLLSDHHLRNRPTFPSISILHNINREQNLFNWDSVLEIPILVSELPSDSVLHFKFFSKLFQVPSKVIGECRINLFTKKNPHLRVGPYTLSFEEKAPLTTLQKHVKKLYTGKEKAYEFIDDQARVINDSLHPKDAERFFTSLLTPLKPPELSETSMFFKFIVQTPASSPSITIAHKNLILPSFNRNSHLNPCQRLYHDLAHSQGPSKSSLLKESNITETLNKIKAMPPLADLQSFHKNFIYNNYKHCMSDPALMPALFRSVNWEIEEETKDIVDLLKTRDPIDVEYALEFFTQRYNIPMVREFAVKCIKNVQKEELILYIPQLLQAVKSPYTSGLGDILIAHSKDDIIFASTVYWIGQVERESSQAIGALIYELLEQVNEDVKNKLETQIQLVTKLTEFLVGNHNNKNKPQQIKERFVELLRDDPVYSKLQSFDPVHLPLSPDIIVIGIDPVDVKVFQSKLRPVMLSFKLLNGGNYRVIFKIGDDMRQDQLIIQLFEVMDHIFKRASMQLNITAYKTLAFSSTFGCCQFIDNSKAILDIVNDHKSIRDFLEEDHQPIEKKIELFTESLAAYSVMTYVLRIGDRHDNNILVTKDGRLLHIDYGFILGDVTKPFTPPLKLSREMIDTIGSDGLQKICDWASPAFNSLRKKARLILVLIELMFTAPLECFQQNPMRRLQQVENSLLLNCTEIEAINSLQATFSESLNSKMQLLWDAVHVIAVNANGPSAEN